jgi:8-oxo-dGTP pyrophosphatase MutT (NUDIX family)
MKIKHSKSAGGIVINANGKILVVNQKGRSWSFPKGHIEKGETSLEAAKREIDEESGVTDLNLIKELGTYQRFKISDSGKGEDTSKIKTITLFLFTTNQENLHPKDGHNPKAIWADKTKIENILTHEKDKEFFRKNIKEMEAEMR